MTNNADSPAVDPVANRPPSPIYFEHGFAQAELVHRRSKGTTRYLEWARDSLADGRQTAIEDPLSIYWRRLSEHIWNAFPADVTMALTLVGKAGDDLNSTHFRDDRSPNQCAERQWPDITKESALGSGMRMRLQLIPAGTSPCSKLQHAGPCPLPALIPRVPTVPASANAAEPRPAIRGSDFPGEREYGIGSSRWE